MQEYTNKFVFFIEKKCSASLTAYVSKSIVQVHRASSSTLSDDLIPPQKRGG